MTLSRLHRAWQAVCRRQCVSNFAAGVTNKHKADQSRALYPADSQPIQVLQQTRVAGRIEQQLQRPHLLVLAAFMRLRCPLSAVRGAVRSCPTAQGSEVITVHAKGSFHLPTLGPRHHYGMMLDSLQERGRVIVSIPLRSALELALLSQSTS